MPAKLAPLDHTGGVGGKVAPEEGPPTESPAVTAAVATPRAIQRQDTLIRGVIGYHSDTGKLLREVVLAELRQVLNGVALGAAVLPLLLAAAVIFRAVVDDLDAADDYRYPTSTPGRAESADELTWPVVGVALLWGAELLVTTLGLVLGARLVAQQLGLPRSRALRVWERLLVAGGSLTVMFNVLYERERVAQRMAFYLVGVVLTTGLARALCRGQPRALSWLVALNFLGMLTMASLYSWWAKAFLTRPSTSDAARLLWLGLVQPVFVELVLVPARVLARRFPGSSGASHHRMLSCAYFTIVHSQLFVRFVVAAGMSSAGAQLAAVAVVTAADSLRRGTSQLREFWFLRLARGWPADRARAAASSPLACAVVANFAVFEEVGEVLGIIFALELSLLFRIGPERQAPAAAPLVLSALLQLGVGTLRDLVVNVGAVVAMHEGGSASGGSSPWHRFGLAMRHLAVHTVNVHTAYEPRFWRCLALLTLSSALVVGINTVEPVAGEDAMYCAWSRSGSWYHYVPCQEAAGWISSSRET